MIRPYSGWWPRAALPVAALVALGVGCAKDPVQETPPAPISVAVALAATPSVNPDPQGRPSPVTVRVYELTEATAFGGVDLVPLWDGEAAALGAALIARHEHRLAPGGTAAATLVLRPQTRYLGVVAAFRDYRNSSWRAVVPVPQPGESAAPLRMSVAVDAASVAARLD